ncbi:MBL fold metallo-hydrolase [Kerstersia gyiorum]|uniref:MBL fold metallo-hydrolase n=1 Tax=Kerstersia gyiorum TaxID=206506 RepID=UPI00209FC506|nr:MBL fold metallo-hydrolase [Kerstersia gyiorum]MCP1634407.1 glyoxylase-like metal-dependent hydrolase (beta-lactamase superfamily II) [Kerstersia gyiorum]MCP1636008.1 glyoxylase-like metal-dependent hydrolase (beta-lactamase superfamily II) [Kerstersia gyiorum]MCP1672300.1 glyoxylase-like metal-dependent hydrolase (beta-lactamase superfamily II) [Kerstersia gyiorum]MCP1680211.1 glyoxylase-like metal-dependent hydrolase (beta-lactamase superfamily II) [Kerstersia gyiorum]MCP1681722.1 glyoxyl
MKDALIESFYDADTATVTHIVADPDTGQAAVIDSVLNFDAAAGRISHQSADRILALLQSRGWRLQWLLETHAHADHLSAAPYLKAHAGGEIGIGSHIQDVQRVFKGIYHLSDLSTDGREFDRLFDDDEAFSLGRLTVRVMHTPGHTPACLTYIIGRDAFVGDTLFMPDYGTARCDFPGGDAATLYRSIRRVLSLPPETRLHLCHDYPAEGVEPRWVTTVAEQRTGNIHVHDGISEADFVRMRTDRDRTLPMPRLILPSVQVNVRAGRLPEPEENGVRYLKLPLDQF